MSAGSGVPDGVPFGVLNFNSPVDRIGKEAKRIGSLSGLSPALEGSKESVGGLEKARADASFFASPTTSPKSAKTDKSAKLAGIAETVEIPKPVSALHGGGDLFSGNLSARLVAVFRYLGIPIESTRFERLLALVKRASARTDSDFVSLLAVAADSKGLRLSEDALLGLCSLLDGSSGNNKHEGASDRGMENHADRRDPDQRDILLSDSLDARAIKTAFEASLERNDALSFMNRIKNAETRRWMALPLRLKHGSVEFRGCLRLLLHESEAALDPEIEGLVLEVVAPERTWSFVSAGEFTEGSVLSVFTAPPLGENAVEMERLLREALEPTGLKVSFCGEGTAFGVEGRIEGYSAVDVEV